MTALFYSVLQGKPRKKQFIQGITYYIFLLVCDIGDKIRKSSSIDYFRQIKEMYYSAKLWVLAAMLVTISMNMHQVCSPPPRGPPRPTRTPPATTGGGDSGGGTGNKGCPAGQVRGIDGACHSCPRGTTVQNNSCQGV